MADDPPHVHRAGHALLGLDGHLHTTTCFIGTATVTVTVAVLILDTSEQLPRHKGLWVMVCNRLPEFINGRHDFRLKVPPMHQDREETSDLRT